MSIMRSFVSSFCVWIIWALATPVVAQTIPVRIGYIPVLGASQLFVANKMNWLKEAGFEPRLIVFDSGPNMIQALASGTLDVYVGGVAPLAVARAKGIEVKVVAATAIEEMCVVAGEKLASYFKPGTDTAAALKAFHAATGKPARIATQPPGSVPHTTLNNWLFGIGQSAPSDVTIVTMGIDATQQALLAGAVDGATLREPAVTVSENRDPKLRTIAFGGDMFPEQPGTVVAVYGPYLIAHHDQIEKFVAALVRANDLILKNPEEASGPIEAALGKGLIDRPTIVKALASPATKFTMDPRKIVESTGKMQAYQVKIGTLDKEYPLDGLFDDSFYMRVMTRR